MENNKWDRGPVDPKATQEAAQLLATLVDTAGHKLITGQHTQTNAMEEREYIYKLTGAYPKLVGFELLAYSRNIDWEHSSPECLKEVRENQGTVDTALQLANQGNIIPVFCFHWFSPLGGTDKAFYTEHTEFDPEQALVLGSLSEMKFYHDLNAIADQLGRFAAAGIPVLWRPFHEAEGTWFWWASKGGKIAAELYKKMFYYFTEVKQLHNLIWVWSTPTREAYPGDEFVDVIGWDLYLPEKKATDYAEQYQELRANTTENKVAALTEVGYNPDITMIEKSHIPWAFYMTWSKEFAMDGVYNTEEEIRAMYASEYAVRVE